MTEPISMVEDKHRHLPDGIKDDMGRWVGAGSYVRTDGDTVMMAVRPEDEIEKESIRDKGTTHADFLLVEKANGEEYVYKILEKYYNKKGEVKMLHLEYKGTKEEAR